MSSIDYLLSHFPTRLQVYEDEECPYCRTKKKVIKDFVLKIDVATFEANRKTQNYYHVYYKYKTDVIGYSVGFGDKTIKEALRRLLTYKRAIRQRTGRDEIYTGIYREK